MVNLVSHSLTFLFRLRFSTTPREIPVTRLLGHLEYLYSFNTNLTLHYAGYAIIKGA